MKLTEHDHEAAPEHGVALTDEPVRDPTAGQGPRIDRAGVQPVNRARGLRVEAETRVRRVVAATKNNTSNARIP